MTTSTRARPVGCCALRPISSLPKARREGYVRVMKALADPTRLEILRLVAGQEGATCVCDIVDHFALSQPTISHHLKVLREAGLLRSSKLGIWSYYEVEPKGVGLLGEAAELFA